MDPWLKSLVIDNFRSIRSEITIPLDAPIVLIYDANAAGKTSVFSAIELALTGKVSSLDRTGPDYQRHLLHHGTKVGSVVLETNEQEAHVHVGPSGAKGNPVLDAELQRYYRERCYLGQATLGRLLEVYQESGRSEGSELMGFVKDLLAARGESRSC